MTIWELNRAMNGIDDRFLSAWEERQKKMVPMPIGKGKYKAQYSHRRMWILILAACLVIALALTAYAVNFMGIREALTGTLWQVSPGEAAYITPETASAESDAGWSCALTESLYTGEKIMLSITLRVGEAYLPIPEDANPSDSVGLIGLSGRKTLQEYANELGKTLLQVNAHMEFADWDTNGQGMFTKNSGTDEITIILESEHTFRGPETLTGICKVSARPIDQARILSSEELPLTLTAAPEPEGDAKIFHPMLADSVPGMLFADGTLTKTLSGYRLQLPFTVTDEGIRGIYLKVYCETLDLWGFLDFATGNVFLDIPRDNFGRATIQIRDCNSEVVGTVEILEQIG